MTDVGKRRTYYTSSVILGLLFSLIFLLGWLTRVWTLEPQVVTQIEYVEVAQETGYDFRLSDNTTMSLEEAILFTEGNIRSHQFYLDHPELQNKGTGDTAFNEKVIGQYNRLIQLLKRMGGN